MTIAFALGRTIKEVGEFSPTEFAEWLAFLRMRDREIKARQRRNR